MNNSQNIYIDTLYMKNYLKGYASPKSKLTNLIKSGKMVQLRRGLYLEASNTNYSLKTIANKLYGPSYISFEYALSYYGLIPEAVKNVTSAIYNKNKNKSIVTPLGTFFYKYINPKIYPYGIVRIDERDNPFIIATPEKALFDVLSKIKKYDKNVSIQQLLYSDLRIDSDKLAQLNIEDMKFLAPIYKKRLVSFFLDYFIKEMGRG